MGTKIRVLMIDDHKLFLAGLCDLVNREEDMEVVGAAECGSEGIALALDRLPDVAVLDLSMPDMGGVEVAKALKQRLPGLRLAVLTMHLDIRMIFEVLKAGVDGYILKEASAEEFLRALRVIRGGGSYLSPRVTTLLIRDYLELSERTRDQAAPSSASLSDREREVLRLLVKGMASRAIGEALHISKSTVDTHRRNILDKVGCENVTCLTRYALREGLIDLEE